MIWEQTRDIFLSFRVSFVFYFDIVTIYNIIIYIDYDYVNEILDYK